MATVKMLVQTNHKGNTIRPDDIVNVSDEVAARWISRNLAELADPEFIDVEDSVEDVEDHIDPENQIDPAATEETTEETVVDPYAGKSAKELYELCKEQDIKAEPKKSAEYYIELLTAKSE